MGPEEVLQLILLGEEEGLSTEEICRRYGIKRHTYYRWKRRLIRAGLDLLQQSLRMGRDQTKLEKEMAKMQQQIVQAQRARMTWELRYKWLWWQLSSIDDPHLQRLLKEVERKQIPLS